MILCRPISQRHETFFFGKAARQWDLSEPGRVSTRILRMKDPGANAQWYSHQPDAQARDERCPVKIPRLRVGLMLFVGWPERTVLLFTLALLPLLSGCGIAGKDQSSSATTAGDFLERVTEKGPVKLAIRVSPKEPRLSDLVEVDVQVISQTGVEIKPPEFGQSVGDFLVRDYGERSDRNATTSPPAGETSMRRFRYQLEPMHAGRHLIRSFAIEFVDNRPDSEQRGTSVLIESEPIEINVTSELGDQVPSLGNLEPMLPPRPLENSSQWNWFVGAVVVGLIALVLIWLRRRKIARAIEPPRLTPEEIAHAAFAALLSENLPARGQFKEFYLRLTGIVRHFIEGTTGLRAPEQTTEEFLHAMRSRTIFSIERSGRLKEFLEAADMVKYAGQQPDDDQIALAIARAREFVDYRASTVDVPVQKEI